MTNLRVLRESVRYNADSEKYSMKFDEFKNVFQAAEGERARLESEDKRKLEKLTEQVELECQTKSEDLDRKHAYKLEQLRQQLAEKHEKAS